MSRYVPTRHDRFVPTHNQCVRAPSRLTPSPNQHPPIQWEALQMKKFLGCGSFGIVYSSKSNILGRNIAVKMIPTNNLNDEERQKCLREVNIMLPLTHANIMETIGYHSTSYTAAELAKLKTLESVNPEAVRLLEAYIKSASRRPMEFVLIAVEECGMPLNDWLDGIATKQYRAVELASVVICQQLICGLKFMHQKLIIHRDLKPSNIFLSKIESLPIKIGDFGQSKFVDNLTLEMTPNKGAPLYSSPETRNENYGIEVDVYSLGLIIFEVFHPMDCHVKQQRFQHLVSPTYGNKVVPISEDLPDLKITVGGLTCSDVPKRLKAYQNLTLCYKLKPQIWKSLEDFVSCLYKIECIGHMPLNFNDVLRNSVAFTGGSVSQVQRHLLLASLKSHSVLFHYNENTHGFSQEWKFDNIKTALKILRPSFPVDSKLILREKLKIRPPSLSHDNTLSNVGDRILPNSTWSRYFGNRYYFTSWKDYTMLRAVQSCTKNTPEEKVFSHNYWYILQSLKMGTAHAVAAGFVEDTITRDDYEMDSDDSADNHNPKRPPRLSRIDLLILLLSSLEGISGYELCQTLGNFSIALPLIMPRIQSKSNDFISLVPWLKSITIRRDSSEGNIIDSRLFGNPFKLIVALRYGKQSKGKSYLLNSLFRTPYLFTSRQENGSGNGKPLSLFGMVEFVWLTQETLHDNMFRYFKDLIQNEKQSELILLANLHGDATDLEECIRYLAPYTSSYLAFHFNSKPGKALIDTSARTPYMRNPSIKLPEIKLSVENHKTKEILAQHLRNAIFIGHVINSVEPSTASICPHYSAVCDMTTKESSALLKYLATKKCYEIKDSFHLQKIKEILPEHGEFVKDNLVLRVNLHHLKAVLELPLKFRQTALMHLEIEMSVASSLESKTQRFRYCQLQQEMIHIFKPIENPDQIKLALESPEVKNLESSIRVALEELERSNLGLEHLIREVGATYNVAQLLKMESDMPVMEAMIHQLAEVAVEGQSIEIVNGDLGTISGPWLKELLKQIDFLMPDTKVFVLSILGLQSSGKSTLLNALFGSKFPVSAGRCTRGLFLKILRLDKSMQQEYGFDALLVIDTEGMCAPEKVIDKEADQRDREMATFAMLLSNLTIVNLMGETMKSLTDILQIVILSMARIEKIEMPADVVLVQHCAVYDNTRLESASRLFAAAIEEAIKVTDKNHADLKIVNSICLTKLKNRVKFKDFLCCFHPYRGMPTSGAPPSEQYYEDVKKLYSKIFSMSKETKAHQFTMFSAWRKLLHSYWEDLKRDDFAMKFKNIQEITEFIDRSERIARAYEKIEDAISNHRKSIRQKYRLNILLHARIMIQKGFQTLVEDIKAEMKPIIFKCKESFANSRHSLNRSSSSSSYTHSCGCWEAMNEITKLEQFMEGKSMEQEMRTALKEYVRERIDGAIIKLEDSVKSMLKLHADHEYLDQCLYNYIVKYKNKKSYRPVAVTKNKIVTKVLSQINTGERLLVLDENWKEVFADIQQALPAWTFDSNLEHRLKSVGNVTNFTAIEALEKSGISAGLTGLIMGSRFKFISNVQEEELKTRVQEAIKNLATGLQADYQNYTISKLVKELQNIITSLEMRWKCTFQPNFKYEINIFGLQKFWETYMVKLTKQYVDKNNSLCHILPVKLDAFLAHSSFEKQCGMILSECTLSAVLEHAKKDVEQQTKLDVLKQPWISNTVNVRLTYINCLFEELENSDFVPVAKVKEFFRNPTKSIKSWFQSELDRATPQERNKKVSNIYNNEVRNLWKEFNETTDDNNNPISYAKQANNVLETCVKYLSKVEKIFYCCDIQFSDDAKSKDFLKTFFSTWEKKKDASFDKLIYKEPSESRTVMDKLGCTKRCPWCGAICWGHASHETNRDVTRKHHTSHIPMGLFGVRDGETGTLIAKTCENIDNELQSLKSLEGEVPLHWRQIKYGDDFDDWIFVHDDYEDSPLLMTYLFSLLQCRLAKEYNAKEMDSTELEKLGVRRLETKTKDIRKRIEQRVGRSAI